MGWEKKEIQTESLTLGRATATEKDSLTKPPGEGLARSQVAEGKKKKNHTYGKKGKG